MSTLDHDAKRSLMGTWDAYGSVEIDESSLAADAVELRRLLHKLVAYSNPFFAAWLTERQTEPSTGGGS